MDESRLIIIGVIVVILAVVAGFMLTSSSGDSSSGDSVIDIISASAISENGTVDVKLTNSEGVALKDKTVHITVTDKNGKEVFSQDAKTFANGVANIRLTDVAPGTYDVKVSFDGDSKFTGSSVSEKLTINAGVSEEPENDNNSTSQDTTTTDGPTQTQTSSSSYSSSSSSYSSSSSSSQSSSSDDGGDGGVVDENGQSVDPVIDENGKQVG